MGLLEPDWILASETSQTPTERHSSVIVKVAVQEQAARKYYDQIMMRPSGILLIIAAIALGVVGVLLAKRPVFYSSSTVVKVTADKSEAREPSFIETEIAVVESDTTLNAVIMQLKLNEAWGQRLNRGNALETSQSSQLLKKRVEALSGGGADLIEIKALSEVPEEAAAIANAVGEAYCKYRADYRRRYAQQAMEAVAGEYADAEKAISTSRAKTEQTWEQLDPELQTLATTNASAADGVMRVYHARYSDSLFRYLAASNQLALFPATNGANVDIIAQLTERADKAKAEVTEAENATKSELRRVEKLKNYQAARFEFEKLTQRFAPLMKTVGELQNDLRPQNQPPATIVEPATVPTSPDPSSKTRNQWILPVAGAALLLGAGLLILGRTPKKAVA